MTAPIFFGKPLEFYPNSHRYKWDGRWVPSVTTIINRLSKPLLIQWAADCAVDYIEREWGRPDQDLPLDMGAICALARKAHLEKRDTAGDVGRIVHDLAVDLQSGKEPDPSKLPPDAPPQTFVALQALREWIATTKLGNADLERRVFSREGMYAGTTDRWGLIEDRWAVLDFKTGNGVYDEAWYQMAGYELALREELGLDEPVWHYLIHLDKNTGRCVPYVRGPNETGAAKEVWRHLVALDKAIRAMPRMQRAA
jgi:hypothetical protein